MLVSVVLRNMNILLLLALGSMLSISILKVEKIFSGGYYSIIYPRLRRRICALLTKVIEKVIMLL